MSISKKNDPKFVMTYDRSMFRSAVVSLFWAVISERKKKAGFTFQAFAKKVGSTKHEVSRWFGGDPNWTLNTVASIANALELDLRIEAVERGTGRVFTSSGIKISEVSAVNPMVSGQPYLKDLSSVFRPVFQTQANGDVKIASSLTQAAA